MFKLPAKGIRFLPVVGTALGGGILGVATGGILFMLTGFPFTIAAEGLSAAAGMAIATRFS